VMLFLGRGGGADDSDGDDSKPPSAKEKKTISIHPEKGGMGYVFICL